MWGILILFFPKLTIFLSDFWVVHTMDIGSTGMERSSLSRGVVKGMAWSSFVHHCNSHSFTQSSSVRSGLSIIYRKSISPGAARRGRFSPQIYKPRFSVVFVVVLLETELKFWTLKAISGVTRIV